jgi:hypothetical protein
LSFKFTYLRQPLNRYTSKAPKIKAWVEAQCIDKDVLNLFAGPTRLEGCFETTNDLDEAFSTDYKMDALGLAQFLAAPHAGVKKFDRVVLDPLIVTVRRWSFSANPSSMQVIKTVVSRSCSM